MTNNDDKSTRELTPAEAAEPVVIPEEGVKEEARVRAAQAELARIRQHGKWPRSASLDAILEADDLHRALEERPTARPDENLEHAQLRRPLPPVEELTSHLQQLEGEIYAVLDRHTPRKPSDIPPPERTEVGMNIPDHEPTLVSLEPPKPRLNLGEAEAELIASLDESGRFTFREAVVTDYPGAPTNSVGPFPTEEHDTDENSPPLDVTDDPEIAAAAEKMRKESRRAPTTSPASSGSRPRDGGGRGR